VLRQVKLVELVREHGLFVRGGRAKMASILGVHRSVVTRDLQEILARDPDPLGTLPFVRCAACGCPLPTPMLRAMRDQVEQWDEEE
jgi:hypothetical protein